MRALNCTSRHGDEHALSPIAWALIELDGIGHVVTGASASPTPRWHVDTGPVMTSRQIISFAIEATAHASSRLMSSGRWFSTQLGAEKLTAEEQRRRFIEAARDAGPSENEADFEATFKAIGRPKKEEDYDASL